MRSAPSWCTCVLLETLEEVVRNLSEVVSKLEMRLAEVPCGGVRVREALKTIAAWS